jgi:phosphoribosylamine-glycine ligase
VALVIVGPEAPLVNGVVDAAREAGLKIGAQLNTLHSLKVLKHSLNIS